MSEKGLFAGDGQSCVETELEADSPFLEGGEWCALVLLGGFKSPVQLTQPLTVTHKTAFSSFVHCFYEVAKSNLPTTVKFPLFLLLRSSISLWHSMDPLPILDYVVINKTSVFAFFFSFVESMCWSVCQVMSVWGDQLKFDFVPWR